MSLNGLECPYALYVMLIVHIGHRFFVMTPKEIERIGNQFYRRSAWRKVREEVLKLDQYECQVCKSRGKYSKAIIVHHVKHLEDYPELALSIYDGKMRQLISVCRACHEALHPERMQQYQYTAHKPVTREQWD